VTSGTSATAIALFFGITAAGWTAHSCVACTPLVITAGRRREVGVDGVGQPTEVDSEEDDENGGAEDAGCHQERFSIQPLRKRRVLTSIDPVRRRSVGYSVVADPITEEHYGVVDGTLFYLPMSVLDGPPLGTADDSPGPLCSLMNHRLGSED
jgi:hypothetical protein